jgi:hypothetical protein
MFNGNSEVRWEAERLFVVRIAYATVIGIAAGIFHTWNLFFMLSGVYCVLEFLLFLFFLRRATKQWRLSFTSYAFIALYLSIVTIAIFGGLTKFITDLLTI